MNQHELSSEARKEALDALVIALGKAAVFFDDCHRLYYRPGSGWLGWGVWAKTLRDWAGQLARAYQDGNDEEVRSILKGIRQGVVEMHMGSLADNWITDEHGRISIEELNKPFTEEEKNANKRKDELLQEIRKHYSLLAECERRTA